VGVAVGEGLAAPGLEARLLCKTLDAFTDVRELQRQVKRAGIEP
jgi:hypothetical protein